MKLAGKHIWHELINLFQSAGTTVCMTDKEKPGYLTNISCFIRAAENLLERTESFNYNGKGNEYNQIFMERKLYLYPDRKTAVWFR